MLPDIQGLRYLEFGSASAGALEEILKRVWFRYMAVAKMPGQDRACRAIPRARLCRSNTEP